MSQRSLQRSKRRVGSLIHRGAQHARLMRLLLQGNQGARITLRHAIRRRLGLPPLAPATYAVNPHFSLLYRHGTDGYAAWSARFDTPDPAGLREIRARAARRPLLPVLLGNAGPAGTPLSGRTRAALGTSIGVRWREIAADKGPVPPEQALTEQAWAEQALAGQDFAEEISAEKPSAEKASAEEAPADQALAEEPLANGTLADGEIVVLLEAGTLVRPHALALLTDALLANRQATLAYADEDRLDLDGQPSDPWFKPAFDPLLATRGVLLGGLIALRWSAADAQRHSNPLALALAAAERGQSVHLPHVLSHRLTPRPEPLPALPPTLPATLPTVSILIPTRDNWSLLDACLTSLEKTDWPHDRLEIIVIDNGSVQAETQIGLADAAQRLPLRVLSDEAPFNYARLNNRAVAIARGTVLVLLNNDTECHDPLWLRKMAAYVLQPWCGAVGPKLLYPDGTVQHGGVVLGIQGVAGHAHVGAKATAGGYANLACLTHQVAAVTGACLMVRRDAYRGVGGLDETFRVSFNDVLLCLDLHRHGLRNVYYAEPLFLHRESRTRGYDDTVSKRRLAVAEARLARVRHTTLMRDDPCYSPNLSLEEAYVAVAPPRHRAAWRPAEAPIRVMVLSITYEVGRGVAVVINQQVPALLEAGIEVVLAGVATDRDYVFDGHPVHPVADARAAAMLAADQGIDVIVVHTPPFFNVARWTGAYPLVLAYDYGEPPPELFGEAAALHRRNVRAEKSAALSYCTRVLAISDAIAAESVIAPHGVIPLGNAHLGRWSETWAERRAATRARLGFSDKRVVLTICRFGEGERAYKGVDTFADVSEALQFADPSLAGTTVFVLCGNGAPVDVDIMRARGLIVFANLSDADLTDMYAASDFYASFSQWEGYNLGIGQALAMGLPVVASDIPAHRAFGVPVVASAAEAARQIAALIRTPPTRIAQVTEWEQPLASFVAELVALGKAARCSSSQQGRVL